MNENETATILLDEVECATCRDVRGDALKCEWCDVRGCECVVSTWRSTCGAGPDGEDLCVDCAPRACGCRDCR